MHLCKKEIVKPPRCWGYHLRLFFSHESKKQPTGFQGPLTHTDTNNHKHTRAVRYLGKVFKVFPKEPPKMDDLGVPLFSETPM